MIEYVEGNIFDSDADCIVNPVNCVGVMGGGLALAFKQRFPSMFSEYVKDCEAKKLRIGTVTFWRDPDSNIYVCNFPTKDDFKYDSTITMIKAGLIAFYFDMESPLLPYCTEIKSVAFPKLGCGLGGLKWDVVKPVMEAALTKLDVDVKIYI